MKLDHVHLGMQGLLIAVFSCSGVALAEVKEQNWCSTPNAGEVKLYTMQDSTLKIELTSFGARIVSLATPDRTGRRDDIVLGYSRCEHYVADPKHYFGAVVGRYGNRIAGGRFALEGKPYQVPVDALGNALHGGTVGFSNQLWQSRAVGKNAVEFTLVSPDGEMGFPGTLTVHVRYTLRRARLVLDYSATTTKPTVLNLTNHTYFNLAGEASGDVLRQEVLIDADRFTPVNAALIPIGEEQPVEGTPFDFRRLTPIGARIHDDDEQLKRAGGYDENFVLNGKSGTLRRVAEALDRGSGRTLTVLTTQPGLQFYSGNFLDGSVVGYAGVHYQRYAGFCMETQHFPDSPNHPEFPTTELLPGARFHSQTVFTFGVAK